ncbi:MAG: hypothetical protein Q9175_002014 [Cornicularia normoerica]
MSPAKSHKENDKILTTNHTLVITLPLNLLYTVRLVPKQKLGLAAVFSILIIIILTAIARAVQISRKAFADGVLLALWGIIESTSLFKGHRSPQRYNSSVNGKNLSLGLRLDVIRHGSAETGDSARPIAGEQRGEQQGSDHGYGGGYQVPPGAIGVTNDYVSCSLGA